MVARIGSVDRWFAQARSAVGASEVARRNAGTCGGGLGPQDCALRMHAVPTAEPPRDPVALRAWGVRSPVRVAIAAGARSGPPLRSPRLFAAPIPASSTTFAQEAEDGGGATGADESSPCWPLPKECCDLSKGNTVQPEGMPSDDGTSPSGDDCDSALEPEPDPEDETPTGDPEGDETSDTTPGKFGGGRSDGGGTGTNWDDWVPENWPGADVPTGETPTAPTTPTVPTGPTGTTGIDDDGGGDEGGGDDDGDDADDAGKTHDGLPRLPGLAGLYEDPGVPEGVDPTATLDEEGCFCSAMAIVTCEHACRMCFPTGFVGSLCYPAESGMGPSDKECGCLCQYVRNDGFLGVLMISGPDHSVCEPGYEDFLSR